MKLCPNSRWARLGHANWILRFSTNKKWHLNSSFFQKERRRVVKLWKISVSRDRSSAISGLNVRLWSMEMEKKKKKSITLEYSYDTIGRLYYYCCKKIMSRWGKKIYTHPPRNFLFLYSFFFNNLSFTTRHYCFYDCPSHPKDDRVLVISMKITFELIPFFPVTFRKTSLLRGSPKIN